MIQDLPVSIERHGRRRGGQRRRRGLQSGRHCRALKRQGVRIVMLLLLLRLLLLLLLVVLQNLLRRLLIDQVPTQIADHLIGRRKRSRQESARSCSRIKQRFNLRARHLCCRRGAARTRARSSKNGVGTSPIGRQKIRLRGASISRGNFPSKRARLSSHFSQIYKSSAH